MSMLCFSHRILVKRTLENIHVGTFFFLSNVRNFIDQNETKLETSKSEYTGMYKIVNKRNRLP